MNPLTRALSLIFFSACLSSVPACSSEVGEVGEEADEHPEDGLDPAFDDGLRALLSADQEALPLIVTASDDPQPASVAHCTANAKSGLYCGGDKITGGTANVLYRCPGPSSNAKAVSVCAAGCLIAPAGSDDSCKAVPMPTCAATAKVGEYCGNDKVSYASPNTLYHCTGPGTKATVVKVCSHGCLVAPAGSDDSCKAAPGSGPTSPPAAACPHVAAILKWGLHPLASDRLRCAGITAARISQTIGGAPASAGTHLQDGVADGHPYSAATDLSVTGLSDAQVKTLLTKLDALGFAAFFRNPGHDGWPSSEARHVHVVFAGAKMKASLQSQIADFGAGKNGLASHTAYTFYQPPADVKAYIKSLFNAAN